MADSNGAAAEPVASSAPPTQTQTPPPSKPTSTIAEPDPSLPTISTSDSGFSKRPRDARLIHLILGNLGVSAYQERVPLQLMDFAYRYTSGILQDALHLASEVYGPAGTGGGRTSAAAQNNLDAITLKALQLSVESRTHYQFSPGLPKEYLEEEAKKKNVVALPPFSKETGMKLPPEKYLLTGVGYTLRDEWESEGDEEVGDPGQNGDDRMDVGDDDLEGVDDEDARMEDIFGEGGEGEVDKEMES